MRNDHENKNETNYENEFEVVNPLRGILKIPDEHIIDHKFIKERLIIVCLLVLSVFIITPLIVYFIIL